MFDEIRRIHITGLGSGLLSGLARILHHRGHQISGSADRQASILSELDDIGIDAGLGFDAKRLDGVDLLIVAPDLEADNPEIESATAAGVEIIGRAQALAQLVDGRRTIGVTGTHGRATVTSMIAWILECAGLEPGFVASTRLNNFGIDARQGGQEWCVVELDERVETHHPIHCDYVVCNFLELDSVDYYDGSSDIVDHMVEFLETNRRLKECFVNLDCLGNRELVRRVALRPTGYAFNHRAEFRGQAPGNKGETGSFHLFQKDETGISDEKSLLFQAFHRDRTLGSVALHIPGIYNTVNALGALAVASRIGISQDIIAEALESYEGLQNRYTVARGGGVTIAKDFVSHPTGIEQVLKSARQGLRKDAALIAVFKPYAATLSPSFRKGYAAAFVHCDQVVVTPATAKRDREKSTQEIEQLVQECDDDGIEIAMIDDEVDIDDHLVDIVSPGDEVVFFGADQFLRRADHVRARLASQAAKTPAGGKQPRLDGPLTQRQTRDGDDD